VALLRMQRGHLRGLDLARLALRGVYFQGVEMQDASLAGATLYDSIFTEAFGTIISVAADSSGRYWAACNERCVVWVWQIHGQLPRRIWQASTATIWRLAFSPDGRMLAGGGWDGMVRLWEVTQGRLLWSSVLDQDSSHIYRMAFAPDNRRLASVGSGGLV